MFFIFWLTGYNISKNEHFLKNSFACIIVFVLVTGSRYGRGNDYFRYIHTFLHDDDPHQIVFTFFNKALRFIGINEYLFFYIYAILFISCALVFVWRYKQYAEFLLPTFLAAFLLFHEYDIRQALGFSFVFLYMDGLTHLSVLYTLYQITGKLSIRICKQILLCLLFAFTAYHIHYVNVIYIIVITGLYVFIRFPIHYSVSIPLYIFASYIISSSFDWSILDLFFKHIGEINELFGKYIKHSQRWFSESSMHSNWQRNAIINFLETMGHCALFYLGYKSINTFFIKRQDLITYFNMFVIGGIIYQAFFTNEISRRVSGPLQKFWFIPLSLVLYYYSDLKLTPLEKIISVFLVFWGWDIFKYIFMSGKMHYFLWDI